MMQAAAIEVLKSSPWVNRSLGNLEIRDCVVLNENEFGTRVQLDDHLSQETHVSGNRFPRSRSQRRSPRGP